MLSTPTKKQSSIQQLAPMESGDGVTRLRLEKRRTGDIQESEVF